MKKHMKIVLIILPLIVILLLIAVFIYQKQKPRYPYYPFASLTADQIVSVEIHSNDPASFPPSELSTEEISTLVDRLHEIVLYREEDRRKYTEWRSLMFTIHTEEGKSFTISESAPLFFIDDTSYLTEPVTANHMGDFYWDCVEKITGERFFEPTS